MTTLTVRSALLLIALSLGTIAASVTIVLVMTVGLSDERTLSDLAHVVAGWA